MRNYTKISLVKQTFPYLSTLLFFIMKKFSLFEEFNTNLETISDIDNCIKITLEQEKMELLPIQKVT
jgi:hypothetical protein